MSSKCLLIFLLNDGLISKTKPHQTYFELRDQTTEHLIEMIHLFLERQVPHLLSQPRQRASQS
jgi:hypothetical protein